jgi:arabinofuranosyltransferase
MLVYRLSNFYKSHFKLILLLVFLALGVLAWSNRFIQDDAFISFRYADNFAHGKGLVWNAGERVEGYTNFLWTIILSIPPALNLDPVKFSFVLGLGLFELSLYFAWRLASILLNSKHLALLVILFLGMNHSFSSYATGGMETQLQTCLFLACMFLLFESVQPALADGSSPKGAGASQTHPLTQVVLTDTTAKDKWPAARLLLLSVLLSLAVLTRLDSLLLVFLVLSVALADILRGEQSATQKPAQAIYLLTPLALVVGGWLIWKARFYGSVLPNTFYVKVASLNSFKRGMIYVYLFFHSYWLVLFPFLYLIFAKRLLQKHNRAWLLLSIITVLWLLYIVAVGGDFMEFRFIVPVLPFILMQIVWLIFAHVRTVKLQIVMLLLVLAGSLHHALTFANPSLRYYDVESTKGLADLLTQGRTDWIEIGKVLGDAFDHDPNVSIATTAAGAIPFYSRLKTVDILGLNDKWVARHGEIVASKPGHQRRAPLNYLMERKVNLLIGHPQMVPINSDPGEMQLDDYYFYVKITKNNGLPANARIIEIPINSNYKLRVLYLVENPLVDAAINRKGWVTYPFDRKNK